MFVPSQSVAWVILKTFYTWLLLATCASADLLDALYPATGDYGDLPDISALIDFAPDDTSDLIQFTDGGDTCGGFFDLETGDSETIHVKNYMEICTAFFMTSRVSRLKFQLIGLDLSGCEDEYLYLNDGATMETTLCDLKVAVTSQDSRFLLFQYERQTDTGTAFNFTVRAVSAVDLEPGLIRKKRALQQALLDEQICPACGRPGSEYERRRITRLIHGSRASVIEHPWMVGIHVFTASKKTNSTQRLLGRCGGTVLDRRHILTAAHCACLSSEEQMHSKIADIFIVAGSDLSFDDQFEDIKAQKIRVERVYIHELYNDNFLSYDIAILKLSEKLALNHAVSPVCLAPPRDFLGSDVTVTGYGEVPSRGLAPHLQAVKMSIRPGNNCNETIQETMDEDLEFQPHQVCLYSPSKDVGHGDSGGPAVLYWEGRSYQIGVVGFSLGYDVKERYGGCARVSSFIPWIKEIIGDDKTC